jgi:hypothetical protein
MQDYEFKVEEQLGHQAQITHFLPLTVHFRIMGIMISIAHVRRSSTLLI